MMSSPSPPRISSLPPTFPHSKTNVGLEKMSEGRCFKLVLRITSSAKVFCSSCVWKWRPAVRDR